MADDGQLTTQDEPPPLASFQRNVYSRKLAVMARCKAIVPDQKHPKFGFEYNSIQQISNRLREFCVEEGLDVSIDFPPEHPGYTRVVLTSLTPVGISETGAEMMYEQATYWYPMVEEDKGFAYSTKYPLIRLFLIGDGEEGDEATMSAKSGEKATQQAAKRGAKPPAPALPVGPMTDRQVALGEAFRALREDGKVTDVMVDALKGLALGPNKRISDLPEDTQVALIRTLLTARGERLNGERDELADRLWALIDSHA